MARRAAADPLAGVSMDVIPVFCAHTERVDPAALVGNPGNPNVHPPAQIAMLARVIAAQGWRAPITVSTRSGFVVRGHGRLAAARLLGPARCPTVPVDRQGYASAAAEWADLIADNRIAELAETDEARLAALVAEVAADAAWDPALTGYDAAALDRLVARVAAAAGPREDEPGDPPADPTTQPGDLWVLGAHRILCGDSTDPAAVARLLDGAVPHLMVTDPPYGVAYDPEWRFRAGVNTETAATGVVLNDDNADWRAAWALFPGDVAYVWHAGLYGGVVTASLEACGFDVRSQIIWDKGQLVLSRGDYHWQHEPCLYAVRHGRTGHWNGDRTQTTVWAIPKPRKSETGHGTQKPVECMRRPVENNSLPGDAIYEPFSGSGTTIIACEQAGRRCYAMELSPAYVDVAVRRWQALTGQRAVHATTGAPYPDPA